MQREHRRDRHPARVAVVGGAFLIGTSFMLVLGAAAPIAAASGVMLGLLGLAWLVLEASRPTPVPVRERERRQ